MRLVCEYGFTLSENIFNRVELPLGTLKIAKARLQAKSFRRTFCALQKRRRRNEQSKGAHNSRDRAAMVRENIRKLRLCAFLFSTIYASDCAPPYGLKKCCSIVLAKNDMLRDSSRFFNEPHELDDNADVMALSYRIIDELKRLLERRADATISSSVARDFWLDQIRIVDELLQLRDDADHDHGD